MTDNVESRGDQMNSAAEPAAAAKAPEQELARWKDRLDESQRIAKIGSWEHNLAERRVWWSDESYRIFGLSPDTFDPTQETILELIHPDDRQRIKNAWQGIMERGEPYAIDIRIRHADGTERTIEARGEVVVTEAGQPTRIAGTSYDITRRVALEREIVTISIRERERIGRDLHDSLGQTLTGISLRLHGLSDGLAREGSAHAATVRQLMEVMRTAIEETGNVSRSLLPVAPLRHGFSRALRALAKEVSDQSVATCLVHCSDEDDVVDGDVATHLLRIAQEAVTNALKHGKARLIEIRLQRTADELSLEVVDDGIGIALEHERAGGIGLRSMAYRTRMIHGQLSVSAQDGGGTRVSCRCPFSESPGRVG